MILLNLWSISIHSRQSSPVSLSFNFATQTRKHLLVEDVWGGVMVTIPMSTRKKNYHRILINNY